MGVFVLCVGCFTGRDLTDPNSGGTKGGFSISNSDSPPAKRGLLGVCFDIIDDVCQGMKQQDKTRVAPEMFSWLAKFGRELAEKSIQRMKSERDGMGGYLFVSLVAILTGERIEQMY